MSSFGFDPLSSWLHAKKVTIGVTIFVNSLCLYNEKGKNSQAMWHKHRQEIKLDYQHRIRHSIGCISKDTAHKTSLQVAARKPDQSRLSYCPLLHFIKNFSIVICAHVWGFCPLIEQKWIERQFSSSACTIYRKQ